MSELGVPPNAKMVFPPHGFVHLQAHCASDLDVVNAARVSFAKKSEWEYYNKGTGKIVVDIDSFSRSLPDPENLPNYLGRRLKEDDEKVLRFLLKNKHGTPFEHNFFKFHIRAPIFVFREWHRHRIGISINEESARYSPLQPDFYLPEVDAVRSQTGKPGRYTFEPVDTSTANQARDRLENIYKDSYQTYLELLEAGVAKEIARASLPVGIYSQMIYSMNARSLMKFIELRATPTAQYEIRRYAETIEEYFKEIMPVTHDAFHQNERVAP